MESEKNSLLETQKVFFRKKKHWWIFGITACFWIVSFGIIWYDIGRREAAIVLHYNVYFGIDILGAWWQAYFMPLSGFFVWVVHIALAWRFFQTGEYALSRVALFSLFFLEGMILIASVAIGLINY